MLSKREPTRMNMLMTARFTDGPRDAGEPQAVGQYAAREFGIERAAHSSSPPLSCFSFSSAFA